MSMCTTFASGAKVARSPVARSSNRAPTANSRSQCCTAVFAAHVPCMPSMPRNRGWSVGKAPMPMSEETTGTPVRSAMRRKARRPARDDEPAADVEQRPLRLRERLGRLADLQGVALGGRVVAADGDGVRQRLVRLLEQHVLGDVDEHGTGPAGGGDVERLAEDAAEVAPVGDEVVVLGHRTRDADDVRLLEGVVADHVPRHLPGDDHERHAVEVRGGEARDRVRRARGRW